MNKFGKNGMYSTLDEGINVKSKRLGQSILSYTSLKEVEYLVTQFIFRVTKAVLTFILFLR